MADGSPEFWLKNALENSNARFKFLFMHHPTGGTTAFAANFGSESPAIPERGVLTPRVTTRAAWMTKITISFSVPAAWIISSSFCNTGDCDVDGTDLAVLIANPSQFDLYDVADNFGKSACH